MRGWSLFKAVDMVQHEKICLTNGCDKETVETLYDYNAPHFHILKCHS